jgi:hypothetical protein
MLNIYNLLNGEYLSRIMGNEIIEVLTILIYQIYTVEKDECNVLGLRNRAVCRKFTELKQMQ